MTYWTTEVHEAIQVSVSEMGIVLKRCNHQISKVVDLVRGRLNMQNRITLGSKVFYVVSYRVFLMLVRFNFQVH